MFGSYNFYITNSSDKKRCKLYFFIFLIIPQSSKFFAYLTYMCDTFTVGNAIYVIKQILHINRNTQSFLFQSRFHTGVKLWDSGILISHKSFFKWNRVFTPRKFLYSLHQMNCDATNTHFLRRVTYNLHSLQV